MHDHEIALHRLAMHIQKDPDSPECVYLRKLLWSLYDPNHCINHHRLYTRTDRSHLPLVNDITTAASRRVLQKADLSRALLVAGEFERAPDIKISPEIIQWSDEANCTIKEADEKIRQANELIEHSGKPRKRLEKPTSWSNKPTIVSGKHTIKSGKALQFCRRVRRWQNWGRFPFLWKKPGWRWRQTLYSRTTVLFDVAVSQAQS